MSPLFRRSAARITLVALTCLAAGTASAATRSYRVSMKGTSATLSGQKFPFTSSGTVSIDDTTGQLTFNANLSNGTTINGTGVAGVGKNLFGNISFTQSGASGIGLITGKASADRRSFAGKFTGGIPDRLGPAPGGFVSSAGTSSGQQQ